MMPKRSVKLKGAALERLYRWVFYQHRHTCQLCDTMLMEYENCAPHHIIPKGRLHLDIEENILTMCSDCHRKLHNGELWVSVDDLIDRYNLRGYLR